MRCREQTSVCWVFARSLGKFLMDLIVGKLDLDFDWSWSSMTEMAETLDGWNLISFQYRECVRATLHLSELPWLRAYVSIENWTACVCLCFTFVYESVLVNTVVLWTSQVSGKQIVKNTKINGIDRPAGPAGPGRVGLFIHRVGPGRYLNAP